MQSKFFAFLSRMKLIDRWSLMRNVSKENVLEHSAAVAYIAHALALIDNTVYGKDVDADKVGMLALYHETAEIFTGDLPTPVKYFNAEITAAYKQIEDEAENKLLSMLPDRLKQELTPLIKPDKKSYEYRLVKAADKFSALIKCIEELAAGNNEFLDARDATINSINNLNLPCAEYFLKSFIDAYSMTLDKIGI